MTQERLYEPLVLECQCGHKWVEYFQMGIAVTAFISRLKGASVCPKCGDRKDVVLLTGKRYREVASKLGVFDVEGHLCAYYNKGSWTIYMFDNGGEKAKG